MNQSQKYIKSAASSFPKLTSVVTNTPSQYKDRQYQFLADRRTMYDEARDYLATDFVRARVQGINPDNFYEWIETEIRLSDVSTQSVTAFDSKQYDDFKEILFRSRAIDYIPVGAYVETMGSIWMVVNPGNMSSPTTNAVIARCRAHWAFYDDYGNIQWEPLVIDRRTMLSNRNESPENLVLMEGYFNIKCQKNANTVKLRDNQRLILGSYAYHITGYTDFFEEFTGDDDSAHVINFTARREEPEEHDDLVNHIADGLMYSWGAELTGAETISVDEAAQLTPHMLLNGVTQPATSDSPQTWVFASADEEIASVTSDGSVRGVSEGDVVITATLEQNPTLTASLAIHVSTAVGQVRFIGVVPPSVSQYSTITLSAGYFVGGEDQGVPLEWEFSGAKDYDYNADVAEDGRSCAISCNSASYDTLTVTVRYNGESASAGIILEGY